MERTVTPARQAVNALAADKGWIVAPGAYSETYTRYLRDDVVIAASWFPGGALREARRYTEGGHADAVALRDQKDRRRRLEGWLKEGGNV